MSPLVDILPASAITLRLNNGFNLKQSKQFLRRMKNQKKEQLPNFRQVAFAGSEVLDAELVQEYAEVGLALVSEHYLANSVAA